MIEATVAIMRLAAGKGLAFLIKVVATSRQAGDPHFGISKPPAGEWEGKPAGNRNTLLGCSGVG